MTRPFDFARIEGAGNVFAVMTGAELAARAARARADRRGPAELARELCAEHGLDGLLEVRPAGEGGDVRMVIWNADGTRPEACGNGLRCVALFARGAGLVSADRLVVETDRGPRVVELLRERGEIARARAELGVARVLEPELDLELPGGLRGPDGRSRVRCVHVDVGNPHCVIFVDEPGLDALEVLGPALVAHPHFPDGTNVELARCANHEDPVRARVWERGVGETAACGTGAAAIAVAAEATGRGRLPLRVALPGGVLEVDRSPAPGPTSSRAPARTSHGRGISVQLTGPVSRVPVVEATPAEPA